MSISKNYLLNIIMTITGILFPVITFPYISRILMPEYMGKITFAQSIAFYFTTLALLGIPIYGIRELSKVKNEAKEFKKILTELLVIGIIGSCLSLILLFIIVNTNSKLKEIKDIIYILSIQVFFSFLNLDYLFVVLERHKRRAMRSIILRIISIILMFTFIKTYKDYRVYVLILVIPELLMRILDFVTIRDYLSFKFNLQLKRHLNSLMILFISAISVSLYVNLDSTMIGLLMGDRYVGLYTSASKMTRILIPLIVALDTVIAPQLIYHIKEKEKEKIFKKIDMFLDFNFFLGVQFIFILFILSKDIILLFSGERFIEANVVMNVMLPIIFFIPIGSFMSGRILISHGLEKLSLKFNIIGMISNATLNYILIPKFGIVGAGFATMLTEGLMCILKSLRVKKIYPDYNILTLKRLKYIGVGLFTLIFTLFIKDNFVNYNYFLNIIILGSIYVTIYLFLLLILKDKIVLTLLKKTTEKIKKRHFKRA